MKPSVGRIVHAIVDPAMNNGSDVAPAIVTRVWSDTLVNVKVILDSAGADLCQTSVALFEERPANEVKRAVFWPPRVD